MRHLSVAGAWVGAQWLAKALGTSPKPAGDLIENAKAIEGLPPTRGTFAAGR